MSFSSNPQVISSGYLSVIISINIRETEQFIDSIRDGTGIVKWIIDSLILIYGFNEGINVGKIDGPILIYGFNEGIKTARI